MKHKLYFFIVCITSFSFSQTTFWTESFETDGNGSRYSAEVSVSPTGSGASCNDYFFRSEGVDGCSGELIDTNLGSYSNIDGSFLWVSEDHDDGGVGGSRNPDLIIDFNNIPTVAGKNNLAFRGYFGAGSNGAYDNDTSSPANPDYMIVEYQIDGGGYQSLLEFHPILVTVGAFNEPIALDDNSDGYGDTIILNNVLKEFVAVIPTTGTSLDLRIRVNGNASNEEYGFDKFELLEDFTLSNSFSLNMDKIISIYPNPTKDKVKIRAKYLNEEEYSIRVYNTFGQTISSVISQLSNEIEVVLPSSGMYFIEIKDMKGNVYVKKILKN